MIRLGGEERAERIFRAAGVHWRIAGEISLGRHGLDRDLAALTALLGVAMVGIAGWVSVVGNDVMRNLRRVSREIEVR